jgi:hypothetical protein
MTVLVWHGVAMALTAALFAWLGRRFLRWPTWSPR